MFLLYSHAIITDTLTFLMTDPMIVILIFTMDDNKPEGLKIQWKNAGEE